MKGEVRILRVQFMLRPRRDVLNDRPVRGARRRLIGQVRLVDQQPVDRPRDAVLNPDRPRLVGLPVRVVNLLADKTNAGFHPTMSPPGVRIGMSSRSSWRGRILPNPPAAKAPSRCRFSTDIARSPALAANPTVSARLSFLSTKSQKVAQSLRTWRQCRGR